MNLSEQNWRDLEIIWDFLDIKQTLPDKADVGIVGGEGNLTDAADRAAELYKEGTIPLIVVSGFSNPYLDGTRAEAELLDEALQERGVPEDFIIKEPNATNTAENMTNSIKLLEERGIKPTKVILIYKPYMTRRSYATALAHWPNPQPEIYATSIKSSMHDFYEYDKSIYGGDGRMITLMLGDYERVKEYPKHGWMVEQEIPPGVEAAYNRLKEDGIGGKPMKVKENE